MTQVLTSEMRLALSAKPWRGSGLVQQFGGMLLALGVSSPSPSYVSPDRLGFLS